MNLFLKYHMNLIIITKLDLEDKFESGMKVIILKVIILLCAFTLRYQNKHFNKIYNENLKVFISLLSSMGQSNDHDCCRFRDP